MLNKKGLRLVVSFHTTAAAMETERLCKAEGIAGRLLPAPRSLTSDCGIAWAMEPTDRARFERLASQEALELAGIAELII